MEINDCVSSIRQEVITILERICDDLTTKGRGFFLYYVGKDIDCEDKFNKLLKSFLWLSEQKVISDVECFRSSLLGSNKFRYGWFPLNDASFEELFFIDFSEDTIGDLTKIRGVLEIDQKELLEIIKPHKETKGGQGGISKSALCINKKQGRFKYGEEEWGHKYGRGGVLKALARNPQYESSSGRIKEGTPVPMEALIDAFKEGEQRRIKGIGNQKLQPTTITGRSVRDAIDDIRRTASKHITKENARRGIKKAAKELFEIKPLGGPFLLVLKG